MTGSLAMREVLKSQHSRIPPISNNCVTVVTMNEQY